MRTRSQSFLLGVLVLIVPAVALAGTVTIANPTNQQTVSSPFQVTASASSSSQVKFIQVYLDGAKVYEISGGSLDTKITASAGTHRVTVQAADQSGSWFKSTVYVSVSSTTSSSTTGTKISDIDEMSGWSSCDVCSGAGGNGATTPHTMTQGITTPSMDNNSSEFFLGGTTSYASALWWKQLGAQSSAKNFVYDLYFYLKDSTAPQALEFDVNQSVNGNMFVFGTECDIRGSKTWRVWDYNLHWVSTGIPCITPTAYTWHHLVWEFERTDDGHMHFISVTLDGVKNYVNKYHTPRPKNAKELNVAFQMDGNKSMTDYSVWLDKVSLTYW